MVKQKPGGCQNGNRKNNEFDHEHLKPDPLPEIAEKIRDQAAAVNREEE